VRITPLIFIVTSSLLAACAREDWSSPNASCQYNFPDSSSNNPKHAEYQQLLDYYVKQGVPGLTLHVRTPSEGLWIGSAGKSKIETNDPMLPCNIHHSASVVKMYVGTSIMLLVEDGEIELDKPISNYLDDELTNHIGNGKTATVRQLLNHTSGIRDFIIETKHLTDYFNDFFNDYTTSDFLHYIYDKPADFEPGTSVAYSNTNFVLLTLIIDRVTGRPHADFMTERIFKPFGLNETFYKNEPGYPSPSGMVNSYWDRYGDGNLENITNVSVHFDQLSVGHDGMLASVHDYAKFIEALLNGQIVSAESLDQMMQWQYDKKEDVYYGLALIRQSTDYGYAIGHGGGNFGVAMEVLHFRESDITIVLCSNVAGFFESSARQSVLRFAKGAQRIAFKK
jgi:D-alanyl-D-alanine carboxypeptidase